MMQADLCIYVNQSSLHMTLKNLSVLLITIFGCWYGSAALAQTYQPAKFTDLGRLQKIKATFPEIDRIYKTFAEESHWPGLVYGVVVDGKLVHVGTTGYTDVANHTPVTTQSEFRIASMTKSFTAMAILKLRDEGKLKLDDPAEKYVPEMKNIHYLTTDAPKVTIRNLLTHTAGYPEDNPWGDRQLADSDDELLALYRKGVSFSTNPGTGYEYSNLGFATLGYIIKKVSGKTYEQYITENILQPLGMMHTYWEYTKVPKNELAHGYRWLNNQWVEQPLLHDGSYGAMGGLITSIEDFTKYVALHLSAWPARNDAEAGPVKRSSIREMQYPWDLSYLTPEAKTSSGKLCPTVSAYAYGLRWAKDCENHVYIGHTGGLPGFGSQWNTLPDYGVGVICFANLTYASAGVPNTRALDALLASGIQPRQLPPSAILNERKNELEKLLPAWSNPQATGIFAQNFFMDYFPDQLKADAQAAFAKAGNIEKVNELVPENQLRGYFIMEGEKAKLKVTFTLTPETPALIQAYKLEVIER